MSPFWDNWRIDARRTATSSARPSASATAFRSSASFGTVSGPDTRERRERTEPRSAGGAGPSAALRTESSDEPDVGSIEEQATAHLQEEQMFYLPAAYAPDPRSSRALRRLITPVPGPTPHQDPDSRPPRC